MISVILQRKVCRYGIVNDIDKKFISRAKCVCATGTHLSNVNVEGATIKAISIARKLKKKTV